MNREHHAGDYKIGWVCALPIEIAAAVAMLDKTHPPVPQAVNDDNVYQLGEIGDCNVVVVGLPVTRYGITQAARVVTKMRATFPAMQAGLMVGIGGGAPLQKDIRLGDVVVSLPTEGHGGIFQYDFGKTVKEGKFVHTGSSARVPDMFLNVVGKLQSDHLRSGRYDFVDTVAKAWQEGGLEMKAFTPPQVESDRLFRADYEHWDENASCDQCDPRMVAIRTPRETREPHVHYGLIASANQVMKYGKTRDELTKQKGVLCFEMEAAGIVDELPSLIVRGVCDYSDSHKNKEWQPYAALTAAAFAREVVLQLPVARLISDPRGEAVHAYNEENIFDIPRIPHPHFSGRQGYLTQILNAFNSEDGQRGIVSIFGFPGMGKSELCLKYATDNRRSYKYIFHNTASTREQWHRSCDHILGALKLPEANSSDQRQQTIALKRWISATKGWMLIIDDITPVALESIREMLPPDIGGHILVSTRDKFIAEELSSSKCCIELREMDQTEGQELVLRMYNRKDNFDPSLDALAAGICAQLGGLPLALEQATRCGAQLRWNLKELSEHLEENKESIIQAQVGARNPHHIDVIATLELALKQLDPSHAALLNIMLMMRPQALPLSILVDGAPGLEYQESTDGRKTPTGELNSQKWRRRLKWFRTHRDSRDSRPQILRSLKEAVGSKLKLDQAVFALEKASLLRRGQDGEIWVHDFLREMMQRNLEARERRDFILCAAQFVEEAFPNPFHNFKVARSYVAHAIEVVTLVRDYDVHSPQSLLLSRRIGWYYRVGFENGAAQRWYEGLLDDARKILDKDDVFISDVVGEIGLVLHAADKLDEAMEYVERALAGLQKAAAVGQNQFGIDVDDERSGLLSLKADLLGARGDSEGLIALCQQSLLKTGDPARRSDLTQQIGVGLYNQGKYDEAMEHLQRALAGYEQTVGSGHNAKFDTIVWIGDVLLEQGRYDEAIECYNRARAGYENTRGTEHPLVYETIGNIAITFRHQGKHEDAARTGQQALDGLERTLGSQDPITEYYKRELLELL